jgi:AmmeMemoRadiSam system protein A
MPAEEESAGRRARLSADAAVVRQGKVLLRLARQAIAAAVGVARPASVETAEAAETGEIEDLDAAAIEPWLLEPGACFVTLTQAGRLRGCIGSVRARRRLLDDVRSNARAAALADPRFAPLTAAEFPATRIEVSLLSPPVPFPAATEAQALGGLRPGVDGLILDYAGEAQATFLPQVWESLPAPRDFLAQLKRKAGLRMDFWSPAIRLHRYTVVKWQEAPSDAMEHHR